MLNAKYDWLNLCVNSFIIIMAELCFQMSLYMVHRLAKAEEERIHDAMDGGTTSIEWRKVYSARSRRRSVESLLSEELE